MGFVHSEDENNSSKSGKTNLRIAIRVDYGKKVGMGHLTRMSALAAAFESDPYAHVDFYKTSDEPIDYSSYDVVILDTYLVTDEYIASLYRTIPTLVCCDDNALYTYRCHVVLNANLHANDLKISTANTSPVELLGGDYALLRPEFWNSKPIVIEEKPTQVFICLGGVDINYQIPKVVNAVSGIPNTHFNVVLGKDTPFYEQNGLRDYANVSVFRDPESISRIMLMSDIAIISAGSIVYEIASLGIPALTIVQAENQERIAHYLDSHQLMQSAGSFEKLRERDLLKKTTILLSDYSRRKIESQRLVGSVNRQGALRAAEAIRKVFHGHI